MENVTTRRFGRPPGLLWVLVIGAVGVLAWALATTASDKGSDPDNEATPTTDRHPQSSADQEDLEESQGSVSSTTERSLETTQPLAGETSSSLVEPALGEPFLGGDVGYRLVISTTGRPVVIDLDSGTIRYSEGSRVFPVAVAGSWLIVDRATPGGLARMPLDDLAAEPDPVFDVDGAAATFVSSPSGQINPRSIFVSVIRQTQNPTGIDETLYVVDPLSGEATERSDNDLIFDFAGLWADPQSSPVTGPSGGVYARLPPSDDYRQVADGRLLAADDRRALVQSCDPSLHCTLRWLDRENWEPLELHVPDDQQASVVLLHGTDWLLDVSFGPTSKASLLNITTGTARSIRPPNSGFRGRIVLPAVFARRAMARRSHRRTPSHRHHQPHYKRNHRDHAHRSSDPTRLLHRDLTEPATPG